jgi:uncharacterized membrane protein YbhN (UPF0104 family)
LVRLGRVAFALVLLVVLAVVAASHLDELRDVDLDPAPQWLAIAAVLTFVGGALLPLAWRETVAAYGTSLPRAVALRVWCVSQVGRFVPGTVALVASRVVLAGKAGVTRRLAGFSLALELGLVLVWSTLFATGLPSSRAPGPARLAVASAAIATLLALPQLLRRGPGTVDRGTMYRAIALYGVNNLVTTAGSAFLAYSLYETSPRDLILVVAAVNLALVVGMVGITPAGLGVREGTIALLLAPRFGAGNAATVAVAMRAWEFLFELIWIGIALTWDRRYRLAGSGTPVAGP